MEDQIIQEVRKIKKELEIENGNSFEQIFKKHNVLHAKFQSRIVNKEKIINSIAESLQN